MARTANDIFAEHGVELSEDELAHYGKIGMRWGRRKSESSSGGSHNSDPPKPHVKSMSDDELRSAINRLKMEREYSTLTAPQVSAGRKIVLDILKDVGKQQAKNYINKEVEKLLTGNSSVNVIKKAAKPEVQKPTRQLMKLVGQK